MEATKRVVVIGGGISGLSAAHRLRRLAPQIEIILIEASGRLGGIVRTTRVDEFVIEAGPDSFLASKPNGIGLCRELGIESELQSPNSATKRAYIAHRKRLYPIPEGLTGLVPARLETLMASALFSPDGKSRLEQELALPARPAGDDESLNSFVSRRFGDEVYARLVEPLMAGIYAGDGSLLSLQATFPQLRALELEHGSVIRGVQQADEMTAGEPRVGFLTPISGMQAIIDALVAATTPCAVMTGVRATRIVSAGRGFRVALENRDSIEADSVIIATPAFVTADLIGHMEGRLEIALRAIPYASTATVSLALPAASIGQKLDGHGYITPRQEDRSVVAATWVSSKFAHRAPAGFTLIRMFFGRYGCAEALAGADEDLVALAREELREILGISILPTRHWVFRWPYAMPQYTMGHLDRLQSINDALCELPGLYLAGALRGVGVPDCIRSGEDAAGAALSGLAAI